MTKVFISGSRRVSHLDSQVKARLDSIIERQLLVLVGDANGADKAVQGHLHERGYKNVEVFCVAGACRNNLGGWQIRTVTPAHRKKDLRYFASKDREMAKEANAGLIIWDAKGPGTLVNVLRLVAYKKKVVVYSVRAKRFVEIRKKADLDGLISECSPEVRLKAEKQLESEKLHTSRERQGSLF